MRSLIRICLFITIGTIAFSQDTINRASNDLNNHIYYELLGPGLFFGSVNYDHFFRIQKNQGFIARIGLSYYDGFFFIGELNYAIGRGAHYFEAGAGATTFFILTGEENPNVYYRLGYRFIKRNGFTFRIAPILFWSERPEARFLWPSISAGYSF